MKRTFTCIVCPSGCQIDAEYVGTQVLEVTGHLCPKGMNYVTKELVNPERTFATSVRVNDGTMPLASVRLTNPIPKNRIFDVMAQINKQVLTAPVRIGDKLIENVLGLGSDVMVTKNVPSTKEDESARG